MNLEFLLLSQLLSLLDIKDITSLLAQMITAIQELKMNQDYEK